MHRLPERWEMATLVRPVNKQFIMHTASSGASWASVPEADVFLSIWKVEVAVQICLLTAYYNFAPEVT